MRKNYEVTLTRDATESCTVRVAAGDEDEAQSLAIERAGMGGWNLSTWEADEGNCHHVSVTDVEEVEEQTP